MLGWGLRNSVGMAEEPITGGIWTVENSADQLRRNGVDIHRDNPAEELNFHGYLDDSAEKQGGNYGYPNCFALWSTEDFPDRGGMNTGEQFTLTSSRTLNDTTCASSHVPPRLSFQAHTAPLDIKFTPSGSEAFVTFHGSFDYKLSSIPFTNGMPTEPADSRTPLTDVLTNADINNCPDNCFRPDSRQRLFMTSDATGELYVLQRTDILASASSPAAPTSTSSQGIPEVPSSPIFVGSLAMSAALALGGFGIFGFPLGLR
ncbi:Putative six-bladed beta-propeller, TolB [Colletotrichum destructivum]|uniref:Six-bladed beta-propeller, TolB n=1 Tax=Colletotrichum destructivum TaxID=34406 RepID=A0AAX4ISI6_9PEZI|nr:Putative six-bladed beta-propeller, TolB [Colletotrichum destructivum]